MRHGLVLASYGALRATVRPGKIPHSPRIHRYLRMRSELRRDLSCLAPYRISGNSPPNSTPIANAVRDNATSAPVTRRPSAPMRDSQSFYATGRNGSPPSFNTTTAVRLHPHIDRRSKIGAAGPYFYNFRPFSTGAPIFRAAEGDLRNRPVESTDKMAGDARTPPPHTHLSLRF